MDIDELLSQASHNVKKANKQVKEANDELQKEKARKIAAIQRQKQIEKEEIAKRKPPPPPPKQVGPIFVKNGFSSKSLKRKKSL